jgi:RNase adapter protein RapZ
MSEFLVVTGLSGAGRSQAAVTLEDLGWFVVDNLPATLIPTIADLAGAQGSSIGRVALVVGRGPNPGDVLPALVQLKAGGHRVRILFLDAPTDVLVRRYSSTRRPHPLADDSGSLTEAIERERLLFEPVKADADVVVDTGDLNVHQLRDRLLGIFGGEAPAPGMQTTITSFGFKHGLPLDADMVIDCRFLPNPYWDETLRPLSGLDVEVKAFVMQQEATADFLGHLDALLALLLPAYVQEGKSYLSLAFGCTGGQHRSVVVAEEVARRLRQHGYQPVVVHRDIDK